MIMPKTYVGTIGEYQKEKLAKLEARREKSRKLHQTLILKKYGVTFEEAMAILEAQNFICPICLQELDHEIGRDAQIDHSHVTGEFRGIVCLRCNLALGFIEQDITRLDRVRDWLR